MAQTRSTAIPTGWTLELEKTTYDRFVEKEFSRIAFESAGGTTVRITDVQEPNSFGGWGYLVWTDGPKGKELGLVETSSKAGELAESYMRAHPEGEQ